MNATITKITMQTARRILFLLTCNDCYNNKDNDADSEDDIVFIDMQ